MLFLNTSEKREARTCTITPLFTGALDHLTENVELQTSDGVSDFGRQFLRRKPDICEQVPARHTRRRFPSILGRLAPVPAVRSHDELTVAFTVATRHLWVSEAQQTRRIHIHKQHKRETLAPPVAARTNNQTLAVARWTRFEAPLVTLRHVPELGPAEQVLHLQNT
jgi:hypothetical protein